VEAAIGRGALGESGMEGAPENPRDISVDGWFGLFEGEAHDGAGGVRPHAGQGAKGRQVGRNPAVVILDHFAGEAVQVVGSGVVAESGPGLVHMM